MIKPQHVNWDGTGLQVLYLTNIQERLNSTNMAKYAEYVFGTHIWASQKWSGGVYLKRSCSSNTLTLCISLVNVIYNERVILRHSQFFS